MENNHIILEISKIKSLINYKFGDVINEQALYSGTGPVLPDDISKNKYWGTWLEVYPEDKKNLGYAIPSKDWVITDFGKTQQIYISKNGDFVIKVKSSGEIVGQGKMSVGGDTFHLCDFTDRTLYNANENEWYDFDNAPEQYKNMCQYLEPKTNSNVNNQKTYNQAQGYVGESDTDINVLANGQKIIGRGARGPVVKQVQALLVKHYPDKKALIGCSGDTADTCDGIWGKNSIAYAADFQTKKNLAGNKNGVVGKTTYAELLK
jgi:hypothetical protein